MISRPNLLCTEGLLDSGVIDCLWWGNGWSVPTVDSLRKAQHGYSSDELLVSLPECAVIACFSTHFPSLMERLDNHHGDGDYVVVSRDSDPGLRDADWPACVRHIFAISVATSNRRVTPIPAGFQTYWDGVCVEYGERPVRANRVAVAHSLDDPRSSRWPGYTERFTSIEYFRDKPWATVSEPLLGWATRENHIAQPWPGPEYRDRLREHDYLAAPVGYGVERAAYWEAMALGTIPICHRHPELLHFSDMPIAFVDRWEDVTPEWCDANLSLWQTKSTDKLKLSYWTDRIREKRVEIGLS